MSGRPDLLQAHQQAWEALERLLAQPELNAKFVPPPFQEDVRDLKMAIGAIQGLQAYVNHLDDQDFQMHRRRGIPKAARP